MRKVELLLMGLDMLVTHHNEVGIELPQIKEIAELAKEIQDAPNQWSMPVGIESQPSDAKDARGFGQK